MMKSIYTTVAAVLIASLSTAEAWSPSSPAAVIVNRINQNHVIVAPHDVTAAHLTRSTTKLSATTTTNKNTSLSRSTLATKLANNLHLNLIRSLIAKLTTFLTHKSKLVILSTMLTIATFFPQSAVAAKSSLFSLGGGGSTKDSAVISTGSNNDGGRGGGVMKVGKFVVTVGAIGAGASTANKVMRNKFTCNDDDDDESAGGDIDGSVMNKSVVSKNNEESPNGTTNGSVVQSFSAQQQPSTEKKKTEKANNNKTEEIEPLSEEWIQQQLNDAEKRSNVLNDAIKMTQQSSAPVVSTKSVTKVTTTKSPTKVNGNKNNKKKVIVGNTIGIPPTKTKTTTTSTTPLVKNLDSKIEMLQRRDAERSIQQQRINDEKTQVEIEKKKVALVEAERKIELAEMEYKKSQQQQQQEVKQIVVEEKKEEATIINSTPITTTTPQSTTTSSSPPAQAQAQATTPPIKVGPGGSPAKSKEEDLELTTQVILEYVKTMDSKSSGVVDDNSDDE
mmetsp:Transcript_379/g.648  ORF Transcript_379/g.648 Transcript_379/m.648 type:complete len:503 (+) Transcript_379:45-1553(+)